MTSKATYQTKKAATFKRLEDLQRKARAVAAKIAATEELIKVCDEKIAAFEKAEQEAAAAA